MRDVLSVRRPFPPLVEHLEVRDLPTVTMFPEVRGKPGEQYVVEVIRIDSTPTRMTFSQVDGVISVTANQPIVNRSWTHVVTVPANGGVAQFDGGGTPINAVEIEGRSGLNSYSLLATDAPVLVIYGRDDAVSVGRDADGTRSVLGRVTLTGVASGVSLSVNDRAAPGPRTVLVELNGVSIESGASINFPSSHLSALTVEQGTGPSTVDVTSTSVPTSIFCNGETTVNLGRGLSQDIFAPLSFPAGAGRVTLNVNNYNDDVARTITLNTGRGDGTMATLTGASQAPIRFDTARTTAVNFNLHDGAANTLVLNGSADAADRSVRVDGWSPARVHLGGEDVGRVTGLMPAAINFTPEGLGGLTVHTGTGKVRVDVGNIAPPGKWLTLVGHSANTSVTVTEPPNSMVARGQGSLTVANTVTRGTRLTISSPSPSPSIAYQLPGAPTYQVVTDARTGRRISFRPSAVADLTLVPQLGVTIAATLVPTTVNCPASTTVTVGNGTTGGIAAPLTLTCAAPEGFGLNLDDSADPTSRTVTLNSASRSWFDANRVRHDAYAITGLSPAPIYYDSPSLKSLRLATGTGTVAVKAQALDVPNTVVVAHSDNTTVTLGSAGTVKRVRTTFQLHGGRLATGELARPSLVIDDSADAVRQNLGVNGILVPNGALYFYDSLPLNFNVAYNLISGFPGLAVFAPAILDTPSVTVKTGSG